MLNDIKKNLAKSQYGIRNEVFILHYLINFIDKVLGSLDSNSSGDIFAALANFVD